MSKPKIISISIDVTMLKKELFKPGSKLNKAGKTPQYVNLDVFLRKDGADTYGNDYYVKQSNYVKDVPKEEREEMPILGNAKIVVGADAPTAAKSGRSPAAAKPKPEADDSGDDDVPF